MLELRDVSLRRGTVEILDHVDWTVQAGTHWALLGPNGAGKTTILQLAATLMHPTSGTVDVLGQRLGRVDVFALRPKIGLASAALAALLPPAERVSDVVVTALHAVLGRWNETYSDDDEQRARWLLAQVGMDGFEQRRFGTLSEGERRRVQLARALMPAPELLLLDEPYAGLDLGGREDLISRLAHLAAAPDAATSVLVTHHLEELPPTITHACLIRSGAVVAAGPVAEVLTSAKVSQTFGLGIRVTHSNGRWLAQAAS